jgi:hypothetical protein
MMSNHSYRAFAVHATHRDRFTPTRTELRSILSFGGVLSFGRVRTLAAASFMGEGLPPLVLPSPALPPPVLPSPALQASLALPAPPPRSPPVVDSAALDGGVFEAPLFVDGLYAWAASSFSDPIHGWRGE